MSTLTTAPALALSHVAKSFGGRVVLDVGHLTIGRGEIHALLGQNGSGKSTLIKILSGYHDPDPDPELSIDVNGVDISNETSERIRASTLRFVHQDLGLVADMSVLDNLYLGRSYPTRAWTVRWRATRVDAHEALARVGLAHLDLESRVVEISPAERTGVAIARALMRDDDEAPSVLVLDEPTATLPAPEIDRLMATLDEVSGSGVAILYVTHHLDEVFRIATSVSVLRDGLVVASGPRTDFTRDSIVHHLVGSELEAVHRAASVSKWDEVDGGRHVAPTLVVDGLRAARIDEMSFAVGPGQIVGFYGVTGSGRESLLGAIFGAVERLAGTVHVRGAELRAGRPDLAIGMGLGFVPADRKTLGGFLGLSAMENITMPAVRSFWRAGRIDRTAEESDAGRWLSRLDVRPSGGVHLPLSIFSGGNQQKIVLAKWLRQDPRVLLLDEPTQGVDIGAKAGIHRTILDAVDSGLAVLIASSDDEEMAALCSRVHVIHRGRIVDTLAGDEISGAELRRRQNNVGLADTTKTTAEGNPT